MSISSPEIESIVEQSIAFAKEYRHSYCTVEHLLLALISHAPFKKCLEKFGVETDLFTDELTSYVQSLHAIEAKPGEEVTPRRTNALERTINRAVTQVLFTGRKLVTTIDLYLSIGSETNSHAHYFMLKYGVTRNEFVPFWQQNYKGSDVIGKLSTSQADDILSEYTINLTALAREGKLEPMIGRSREMNDIINVLAKRFKSNLILVGDAGVGKCLTYNNKIRVRVPDEIAVLLT